MELVKALDLLIACASVNLVNQEIKDAIETVKLHKQELEGPSPIQIVLVCEGGVIHEAISNVPTTVTVLDGDLDGAEEGNVRLFESLDGSEYNVCGPSTECDPLRVADILKEAQA